MVISELDIYYRITDEATRNQVRKLAQAIASTG